MSYSTFRKEKNDPLKEPIFFGNTVNVARFDQQKHNIFERLVERQISFFWRPEEIDISRDRVDFQKMTDAEKHIFTSNLKYQTLLDSVQGRSPNIAFLPITSLSEFELWVTAWSFFESIHSRSYTHIMRNIYTDPSTVFDGIIEDPHILKRAEDVSKYYDDLIFATQLWQTLGEGVHEVNGVRHEITMRNLKRKLYLCMQSVNALEAIRFYVSFACTFAFAERSICEGSAKILRLIARDENLHLSSTQHVINSWRNGKDDPEMAEVAEELQDEATKIFLDTVEQEKEWAKYLFTNGSMIGLNEAILCEYVEYIASMRMSAIGLESPYNFKNNPLPWMNNYLNSDNVQVAPQESEISSYLVGQIDSTVNEDEFADFDL